MLFDDTTISFVGRWAYHLNPLIPNKFHSFHATNHSGDFAFLNFTGTAVEIFGIGGPHNGRYNITLDGQTSTHSGQTAIQEALLFSQQGLDPIRTHSLVLTNIQEGHLFTVDLVNVTSSPAMPSSASTSPSATSSATPSPAAPTTSNRLAKGTVIAVSLIGALFGIFIILLLFFVVWRKMRNRRRLRDSAATHPRLAALGGGGPDPTPLTISRPISSIPISTRWSNRPDNNMSSPGPGASGLTSPTVSLPFALQRGGGGRGTTRFPQGPSVADTPRSGGRERNKSIPPPSGPPLKSASNSVFFGQNVGNRTTRGGASSRTERHPRLPRARPGALPPDQGPSVGLTSP